MCLFRAGYNTTLSRQQLYTLSQFCAYLASQREPWWEQQDCNDRDNFPCRGGEEGRGNENSVFSLTSTMPWQDLRETLSTLRYASRAKKIQNKPTINEDPKDITIRCLMQEVNSLRQMVESLMLKSSLNSGQKLCAGIQVHRSMLSI